MLCVVGCEACLTGSWLAVLDVEGQEARVVAAKRHCSLC